MTKCSGCGVLLQTTDKQIEGYTVKPSSLMCERCFRIKHYNEYKTVARTNDDFISIFSAIDKKSLVVLVLDLFNLPENMDIIKENIQNPILLVLNKRDILPRKVYDVRLLDYVDKYNMNYVDKIIVSSTKNYNYDELFQKIKNNLYDDKVYFIGFTNSGKSTMINKLMYNYSNNESSITTSPISSTTLNLINIDFDDKIKFIDTPGFLEDGNIEYVIDSEKLKNIIPKSEIKPITYQIKKEQCICIDEFGVLELSSNNVTIYASNKVEISHSYKKETKDVKFKEYTVNVNKKEDLVIKGLCFIKFSHSEKIIIRVLEGVKIYTRKSLI